MQYKKIMIWHNRVLENNFWTESNDLKIDT